METSIGEILKSCFGLDLKHIQKMEGYESLNYKVNDGTRNYVLKIHENTKDHLAILQGENKCLHHLQNSKYSQVILNRKSEALTFYEGKIYRLLTYLEGTLFGHVSPSESLYKSLGRFLADMDLKMSTFEDIRIRLKESVWDLTYFHLNFKHVHTIADPHNKAMVEYFIQQYNIHVLENFSSLRRAYIHNDANDGNLLTDGKKITGLIDFGDMVHCPLICNLGVSLAYVLMEREDPLHWASIMLSAYHKKLPLQKQELDILYYLIAARLCISVINSSLAKFKGTDTEYITSSEQKAWNLLNQWIAINPLTAKKVFHEACQFSYSNDLPTNTELLDRRDKYFSKALSLSYDSPIQMSGAAFQYMYAADGTTYLDAYNNIPHVGHCHPRVVESGQKAMSSLNTNTRYIYPELTSYAEKLLSYFPASLNKIFLVNSGSAATDLAIRLAQDHTKRKKIMVVEHGYHGNTRSGIDISHYKFSGKGGHGNQAHVITIPMPDAYRHPFDVNENIGHQYAVLTLSEIDKSKGELAAFIAEPIVGCGGQVPLAEGYLKEVYAAARKLDILCISDEVQTGFGRMGSHFWGFEMHEVIPDIVILGKPMGNGHPMGAVVCTNEVATSFENGMEFFSSFGGNPVSCSIGLAVLETIENENLQSNALQVGNYFISELRKLQNQFPAIGDVRGNGLFIGVDLVKDIVSKEPDTKLAQHIKNEMKNRHILVSTDGPSDNVIKMKPPLCFNKSNVDEVVSALKEIMLEGTI